MRYGRCPRSALMGRRSTSQVSWSLVLDLEGPASLKGRCGRPFKPRGYEKAMVLAPARTSSITLAAPTMVAPFAS